MEIDGIYYNLITKAKQAEVTRGNYSGEIIIPESVEYEGTTYSVTSIDDRAFSNFGGLTSVTIPNTVISIGEEAFLYLGDNDGGIKTITIGNGLTKIGRDAFITNYLHSVYINDLESWFKITFSNEGANPMYLARHFYLNGKEVTEMEIPYGVTAIGNYALYNFSNLTSVTIPSSVNTIGYFAFSGCCSLTSVNISDIESWCKISFLGDYSNPLSNAKHLYNHNIEINKLEIPNSVTSIGKYTFQNCQSITSVVIPNSVTSIGSFSFQNCQNLTSVVIPNSVTSIGSFSFQNCQNITSFSIPSSVTFIGEGSFSGCSGLRSITIPNSVTYINYDTFYGCNALTSVTIGSGIKDIGSQAFAACHELTDIFCLSEIVPMKQANAFQDSYAEYITLHVPAVSLNSYRSAAHWKGFKDIVPIDDITIEKCATPTITYTNGQLSFISETEDVEFVYDVKINGSKAGTGNIVQLTPTYTVSVYATKEGYENSDVATKEIQPKFGDLSGDGEVNAVDLTKLIEILLKQ